MRSCFSLGLVLCSAAAVHAQDCGVRNHIRLAHGMCNTTGDSETRIDTNWVAVGPLVTDQGVVRDNGCGCHSEMSTSMRSDYGSLSYSVSGVGNSCNCCGIFLWADEWIGGQPKAQFFDRVTITSASLPAGTPVVLRATMSMVGGASASNANTERSFTGQLFFPAGPNPSLALTNTDGTVVRDIPVHVGQSYNLSSQIYCTLRDHVLLNFNGTGTIGANIGVTSRLEPVTPGFSITSCSGHNYGAAVCDSIDFNGDGLFPDTQDIDDFLTLFSGGPCSTGTCGDIDFNNDGLFPDTLDIDALLSVFSGGACL